jgi:predicted HicB family RNase H-like nuclease
MHSEPSATSEKRQLNFTVSPEAYEEIKEAAHIRRVPMAAWCRQVLSHVAKQTKEGTQ